MLTNWKGPDLTSFGELVLEGTFRIQRAKNERTLFLLDKLLLITKKRDDTFTYKADIPVGPRRVAGETWGWGGLLCAQCASQTVLSAAVWQPHACGDHSKGATQLQCLRLQEPQDSAHSSGNRPATPRSPHGRGAQGLATISALPRISLLQSPL